MTNPLDGYSLHLLSDIGVQIPDYKLEQSKMNMKALYDRMKEIENEPPMPIEAIRGAFALGVNPFGLY